MNTEQLKNLLLTFDSNLKKYFWNGSGEDYTLWVPHSRKTVMSDDMPESRSIIVTVHRYTKKDEDDLIYQIEEELEKSFVSTGNILTDYELETGYFHHILDCYISDYKEKEVEAEDESENQEDDDNGANTGQEESDNN